MRALVGGKIHWQYCTEQDPEPQDGRLDFWEQDPDIHWDGNWVQQPQRSERHELQPGPAGKVKTYPAVSGGPPLYLVSLAWEDIVAALPLVAISGYAPGTEENIPSAVLPASPADTNAVVYGSQGLGHSRASTDAARW